MNQYLRIFYVDNLLQARRISEQEAQELYNEATGYRSIVPLEEMAKGTVLDLLQFSGEVGVGFDLLVIQPSYAIPPSLPSNKPYFNPCPLPGETNG